MKMRWKIPLFLIALGLAGMAALYAYILSYDVNRLKPDIIAAVKNTTGRNLTIKGDIKIAIGLSPSLIIEGVSLANAGWGSRPRMLQIKRFELQLALLPLITGTLEVRKASLINSEIFLEVSKNGALNLPYPDARSLTTEPAEDDSRLFLPHIALKNVRIIDSRLIFKGRLATKPITLHLKRLHLKASAPGGKAPLDFTATYNKHPLIAKGLVGPVYDLLDPEKPWSLELAVNTVGTKLELAGHIKNVLKGSGMALDFKLVSRDVSKTAAAAGIRLPFKTGARVAGHLSGGLESEFKISRMKFKTGRNKLHGFVLAKLNGGKPYFNATLTSERLDLRPADRTKTAKSKPASSPSTRKFFPDRPFPTGFLKNFDADVGLRIKQCLLTRTAMRNLRLNLSLKNGRLTLKPIAATIGSGKLRANVAIREVKKKLVGTATLRIDNMDAGRMLKELDISDAFKGKFDVRVDLSGRGRSVADIMTGLNGYVSVIMGRGSFNNRLVRELGGDLSAGFYQLLSVGGKQGKLTKISCFVTRFDIVDGFADARVLVLNTTAVRVVGKGTVNLKTEKLDISLKPIPQIGLGTDVIGKISLSLGNLAKSFKLGGTLADPELAIDPKHAAITIGKAIGGFALFGPFGLAALLVDGDSGKKNLCTTAVAIAKQKKSLPLKKRPANSKKKRKKKQTPGTFLDGLKKTFKQRQIGPGDEQDH
jgi:uncharacterized protein involved in outer membrane biogenesis